MSKRSFFLCCLFACLLAANHSVAQQTSYNYFYRNNWQLVNPAAIDRSHYLTRYHPTTIINAGTRLQWIGFKEAPKLYFVSVEYCPESQSNRPNYKLGLTAYGDKTDAISTYGFYGNYSYFFVLPWGRGHTLHLGGSVGYVQYGVDLEHLHAADLNSDALLQTNQKRSFADFAIGAMYRIRKEFYLGVSSPQTFGVSLTKDAVHSNKISSRQVNVTGGWFMSAGDRDYGSNVDDYYFLIEPSFILRYAHGISYSTLKFLKNSPFSVDMNLRIHYRHRFWYGGGLSTNGTASIEGGINRDMGNDTRMLIGAGYSVPVFQGYKSFGHSMEVTLGYYFN